MRAYAHILGNGTVDQTVGHRGVVSAHNSGAYTCVKLDSSIDALRAIPSATPDIHGNFSFSGDGAIGWAAVVAPPSGCGANEIKIATGPYGANVNSGFPPIVAAPFYLLVP